MAKFVALSLLLLALLALLSPVWAEAPSSSSVDSGEDELDLSDEFSAEEGEAEALLDDQFVQGAHLDDAGSLIGTLDAHPDLSFGLFFPKYEDKRLMPGENIQALVGVKNKGKEAFNLTYSGAHLHSAVDFSYYIQNFSVYQLSTVVPPQSEVSFEYFFKPSTQLEPVDFLFSGWLIYNTSDGRIFRSVFANETIFLQEVPFEWDLQSVLTVLLLLALMGGAGYYFYAQSEANKKKQKKKKAQKNADKPPVVWEATRIYTPSTSSSAAGKKKSKKSDSKKDKASASDKKE